MMRRNGLLIGLLAFFVFLLGDSYAQDKEKGKGKDKGKQEEEDGLSGKVTAEVKTKLPIAVPELKNTGAGYGNYAKMIQKVIIRDLEVSAFFKILDPKGFLADPEKEGLTESSVNFESWLSVGAHALIKGDYKVIGGKIFIRLRLFDIGKKEGNRLVVSSRDELVPLNAYRQEVHRFCNEVIKHYTGKEGLFGTKIVFSAPSGKDRKDIFVIGIDGDELGKVTNNGVLNVLPSWGPGGILFTSYLNRNADLFLQVGGASQKLSSWPGLNTGGALSPDGGTIALTLSKDGNPEIYLINAKSGAIVKRLTYSPSIDTSPTWSPDGSKIAFVSDRSGEPHIYIMSAGGGEPQRITFDGNYNQTPSWSPKGDEIAFTARDEQYAFDIFKIDIGTKVTTRLTQDNGYNEQPSYSPDGRYIVFTSTRDGGQKLYIMRSDGSNPIKVSDMRAETPKWSPKTKME